MTSGHRNNLTWHLTRRDRLTAGNFGCVLKVKWVIQSLLKRLLGEYDFSGVKVVQWGVNNTGSTHSIHRVDRKNRPGNCHLVG